MRRENIVKSSLIATQDKKINMIALCFSLTKYQIQRKENNNHHEHFVPSLSLSNRAWIDMTRELRIVLLLLRLLLNLNDKA